MAETMKDYEKELNESMKKIEEGDILTGTVVSVDEKEVILDLKYYAEGVIPAEDYTREPGFNLKEEVLSLIHILNIIHGDILKTDIQKIADEKNQGKAIKVVANLPYYITTPIIMGLFESCLLYTSRCV